MRRSVAAALLGFTIEVGLTGCAVSVPTEVKPQVAYQDHPAQEVNALVTVGPRRLLKLLAKLITDSAPRVEVVDPLLFRDTAFPQGGWELGHLLETERRNTVISKLHVDFLILISPFAYKVGGGDGFFIPLVAGAQSAEHKVTLSATIYDMNSGSAVRRIEVTSSGKEHVYSYVILFAGNLPRVVTPTLEQMAKEIIKVIENKTAKNQIRIAVLATEDISKQE